MGRLLTPLSSQHFPEAVFPDTIPPCPADIESGEHLHLTIIPCSSYTFSDVTAFYYFVTNLHITCTTSSLPVFQFQLPVKADARMSFIEALKK